MNRRQRRGAGLARIRLNRISSLGVAEAGWHPAQAPRGKPVRDRRGRATVTGERTRVMPLGRQAWEGSGERSARDERAPTGSQETYPRRFGRALRAKGGGRRPDGLSLRREPGAPFVFRGRPRPKGAGDGRHAPPANPSGFAVDPRARDGGGRSVSCISPTRAYFLARPSREV